MTDKDTFEDFYLGSYHRVVRQIVPLAGSVPDAEDAVQEAFARAYLRWSTLRRYDAPEAWVRTVASNLAISRIRRLKTSAMVLLRLRRSGRTQLTLSGWPATGSTSSLRCTAYRSRIDRPSSCTIGGQSVTDIAGRLGLPEGTVKSHLSRGRARLADLLQETAL